jgi:hypothetical protein
MSNRRDPHIARSGALRLSGLAYEGILESILEQRISVGTLVTQRTF